MTGRTVGGLSLYPGANRVSREKALRLWTVDNSWFSSEVGKKGQIKAGQLADLAVLSEDLFSVAEEAIPRIRSVLTVVGGQVVFGEGDYASRAPELSRPMPDWAPTAAFGGYHRQSEAGATMAAACGCARACAVHGHDHAAALASSVPARDVQGFWGAFGCGCWAV